MPLAYTSQASASNFGTSITISKPSGVVQGDLMLAVIGSVGSFGVSAPSGWALFMDKWSSTGGGDPHQISVKGYWKLAGASEPASYTFTGGPNNDQHGVILRYTGPSKYSAYEYTQYDNSGVSSPAVVPGFTPLGALSPVAIAVVGEFHADIGGSVNTPTGYTQRYAATRFQGCALNVSERAVSPGVAVAAANATFGPGDAWISHVRVWQPPQNPIISNLLVTSSPLVNTPSFQATIKDWDGGQQIKARFEIYQNDGTTLINTVDSVFQVAPISGNTVTATATYSSALPIGTYKVKAKAIDSDSFESAYTAFVNFQIQVAVNKDIAYLWNVADPTTPVSKDFSMLWNVEENNAKEISFLWNVHESAAKDIVLLWDVDTAWTDVPETPTIWTEAAQ